MKQNREKWFALISAVLLITTPVTSVAALPAAPQQASDAADGQQETDTLGISTIVDKGRILFGFLEKEKNGKPGKGKEKEKTEKNEREKEKKEGKQGERGEEENEEKNRDDREGKNKHRDEQREKEGEEEKEEEKQQKGETKKKNSREGHHPHGEKETEVRKKHQQNAEVAGNPVDRSKAQDKPGSNRPDLTKKPKERGKSEGSKSDKRLLRRMNPDFSDDSVFGQGRSTFTNVTPGSKNRSNASTSQFDESVTLGPDASALDHRQAALELLRSKIDSPKKTRGPPLQQSFGTVERTLEYTLDENRTTSANVFKSDQRVTARLDKQAPNVTTHLLVSDAILANRSIADAVRVKRILDERNTTYDKEEVSKEIRLAKKAFARAERKNLQRDSGVVPKYRQAWVHAQRAVDLMDWAVKPDVRIRTRDDIPHTQPVTVDIEGTVFSIRSYEITTVTVEHDGTNLTVPVTTSTRPATTESFDASLNLTGRVHEVHVTAVDPNRAVAPHDDEDLPPAERGRDYLRLDGDGLPDWYELSLTQTDPLNLNSDSNETPANESQNAIHDGAEDLDNDTLVNSKEYDANLDPFDHDSDDDNLTDGFEYRVEGVSPLENDSDGDGDPDPFEDLDRDGVINLYEQEHGTNPLEPDTDADELSDGDELDNGTDPVVADTDDDGLLDGEEFELRTDPLNPDTDGDGVLDGEETFTTSTTNESVGISIDVTGDGNVAGGVTLEKTAHKEFENTSVEDSTVSEVIDIEAESDFEKATLTIDYDEEKASSEKALRVYRFDHENQQFVELRSKIDPVNDTVSAETPHFSTYLVMDKKKWDRAFSKKLPSRETAKQTRLADEFGDLSGWECEGDCASGSGRVIVGDDSVSTSGSVGISWIGGCPWGPNDPRCRPGSGDPTTEPTTTPTTTTETTTTETTTSESGTPGGGWNTPEPIPPSTFTRGISLGDDVIRAGVGLRVQGDATNDGTATIRIIGESGSETLLALSDGESRSWTTVSQDLSRFAGEEVQLSIRTTEGSSIEIDSIDLWVTRDSDGDGLPNEMERSGIRNYLGEVVSTNPYDSDSDGDGLTDGSEVGRHRPSYREGGYHYLDSDPAKADTDDDGLDDHTEVQLLTNAMSADTDGDGTIDSRDADPFNEPESVSIIEYYGLDEKAKRNAVGFGAGVTFGEIGMPEGELPQSTSDTLMYPVGWIGSSLVPGLEFLVDGRDALQNLAQGDFIEAGLDLLSFIPPIALQAEEVPKLLKIIDEWVSVNPGIAGDLYRALDELEIADKVPASEIPAYYKKFSKWDDLKQLKNQAAKSEHYKGLKPFEQNLRTRLETINKKNIAGKVTKPVGMEDVSRVGYCGQCDDGQKMTFMLTTNKWKSGEVTQGPGWKHIIARHIHPNSEYEDEFADIASTAAKEKDDTDLFPKDMTKAEVKDAIWTTVQKGEVSDEGGMITYELNKYGIDEMTVYRDEETGMIVSAFPNEGPKVETIEEVNT